MSSRLTFQDLPGEVRNLIYTSLLVHPEAIKIADMNHGFPTALLRTNQAIPAETKSVLYGKNTFDFTGLHVKDVARFLSKIGRGNGEWIDTISITFPTIHQDANEELTIDGPSARVLDKLATNCPNLSNITLGPEHVLCGKGFKKSLFACPGQIHAKMLQLVALRLEDISLQMNVTLKLYSGRTCAHLAEYIDDYAWKICYVKHPFDQDDDDNEDVDAFYGDYEPGYFQPRWEEPDYSDADFYPSEEEEYDHYGVFSDDNSSK